MSILTQAETIINGHRKADYGYTESFSKMAKVYNTLFGKEIREIDCCRLLMVVKLVRESYNHKEDNLVDLAGYAELLNKLELDRNREID